jgi:hypothetical protein
MNMSRVEHCHFVSPSSPYSDRTPYQMRPPHLIRRLSIIQFDIQVLIHTFQRPPYTDFVLQFDGDFVIDKRFEEATQY